MCPAVWQFLNEERRDYQLQQDSRLVKSQAGHCALDGQKQIHRTTLAEPVGLVLGYLTSS